MTNHELERLRSLVRNIPDFPVAGIQFKDLTTLFKDAEALAVLRRRLADPYRGKGITKVLGIESRGFIGGAMLASELGAGFVPVRKPGKLPAETMRITYEKEYGTDTIEIHRDAVIEGDIVLIHDDLLATGGTMRAACGLVQSMKPSKVYVSFICELTALEGRGVLPADIETTSLFSF